MSNNDNDEYKYDKEIINFIIIVVLTIIFSITLIYTLPSTKGLLRKEVGKNKYGPDYVFIIFLSLIISGFIVYIFNYINDNRSEKK